MNDVFVFLGPTLSQQEAEKILPARYFPPAKQGDILSLAVQFRPRIFVLIDGFFREKLSVWHKEILFALKEGIHVFGASSMGALRAAETADFGMQGFGKVFELYKSGEVNDDDEVALIHGPPEHGYIPLSLPLINIRFTLERAQKEKRLTEDECTQIFHAAQGLFYPERCIENIAKALTSSDLIDRMVDCLENHYVDQKKEDAQGLLEHVKNFSPKAAPNTSFYASSLFEMLYHYDRRSSSVSQRDVAHHVALHHPDFCHLQSSALNRALVSLLARLLEIKVTEEEVAEEKKRFMARNGLLFLCDQDWDIWLQKNDLTPEHFHKLLEEQAKACKLHTFFFSAQVPWKPVKSLLEELKLKNEYEAWAKSAAEQAHLLQEDTFTLDECKSDQIENHLNETTWCPDENYETWAERSGFQSVEELKIELLKAQKARGFYA